VTTQIKTNVNHSIVYGKIQRVFRLVALAQKTKYLSTQQVLVRLVQLFRNQLVHLYAVNIIGILFHVPAVPILMQIV